MRLLPFVLLLAACGSAPSPDAGSTPDPVDSGTTEPMDAGQTMMTDAGQPPRRFPVDPAPVTHDVDRSLAAVLETQALQGACEAVRAGATDRATRLRCGKWMFFYETFGTIGVPAPLLDFNQKFYAGYFGRGWENMGFIADPASDAGMPLGIAPTTGKIGNITTRAFTCASCHFGKMSDGRYAVGYGNMSLDYGKFLITIGAPLSLAFNANDPKVHPTVRAELAPYVTQAKAQSNYSIEAGLVGLQLLGADNSAQMNLDEQEKFLALEHGTMDFLTRPLIDDGVWAVSRILSLWNLPDASQRAASHMAHERLSWNAGVPTLENFLDGFVVVGVGEADWTPERLAPLAEYIRTLRTPELEQAPDAAVVAEGSSLFLSKGCVTCHDGPSGESGPLGFDVMGTDDAYSKIYNPAADGSPCCGLGDSTYVTRSVKSPRLTGLAWQRRFLHNGSVNSLEELFCLVPRPMVTTAAQTAVGHQQTCEGISAAEKQALIGFLRSL